MEISTTPGYLPTVPLYDTSLLESAIDDVLAATGGRRDPDDHDMTVGGGSTDYGDISYVMPLLQFHTGGMRGSGHNPNYDVANEDTAYLLTAKLFALITYRLLRDGAKEAQKLKDGFRPLFSKKEYLAYMESMLEKAKSRWKSRPQCCEMERKDMEEKRFIRIFFPKQLRHSYGGLDRPGNRRQLPVPAGWVFRRNDGAGGSGWKAADRGNKQMGIEEGRICDWRP